MIYINISLFNKDYVVRRFGEQTEAKGYLFSSYKDYLANIHIHPMGSDKVQTLPEGERRLNHLEGHGSVKLVASNQDTGTKGDLLFYDNEWYECVASVCFDHTILSHYNYQFVLIPKDAGGSYDVKNPPAKSPDKLVGGDDV